MGCPIARFMNTSLDLLNHMEITEKKIEYTKYKGGLYTAEVSSRTIRPKKIVHLVGV
jgi:alkyl hydroperoxide reductase subunit AhpF